MGTDRMKACKLELVWWFFFIGVGPLFPQDSFLCIFQNTYFNFRKYTFP